MAAFDLRTNAFYILGVSPQSDAAAISRATDEAISTGRLAEAEARAAEALLIDPRARPVAEVGWFPGVPAPAVAAIRPLLAGVSGQYDVAALPAMAKVNVLAHLCAPDDDDEALVELFQAHAEIDFDDLLRTVNLDRRAAGFQIAGRGQIAPAFAAVKKAHVEAVLTAVRAAPNPRKLAVAIVRRAVYDPDVSGDFLERFVKKYLAEAEPRLARAEAAVREGVSAFDRSDPPVEVGPVAAALWAWRREIEPSLILRYADQAEEQRTAALCAEILAVARAMAMTQEAFDKADALHRTVETVFAEFSAVTSQVARNIEEILGAAAGRTPYDCVTPLISALKEARNDFDQVTPSLRVTGFRRGSAGWPGRLYAGFAAAAVGLAGTARAKLPWNLMLNLFDRLRQGYHPEATSRIVLDALAGFTEAPIPAEIADRLDAELQAAAGREIQAKLRRAASDGRTKDVRRLLQRADAELRDKEVLRKVRRVGRVSLKRAYGARSENRRQIRNGLLQYFFGTAAFFCLWWVLSRFFAR